MSKKKPSPLNSFGLVSFIEKREKTAAQLEKDYLYVIDTAVEDFGSKAALSRALGERDRYIHDVLDKNLGFKTIRDVVARIGLLYHLKNQRAEANAKRSDP